MISFLNATSSFLRSYPGLCSTRSCAQRALASPISFLASSQHSLCLYSFRYPGDYLLFKTSSSFTYFPASVMYSTASSCACIIPSCSLRAIFSTRLACSKFISIAVASLSSILEICLPNRGRTVSLHGLTRDLLIVTSLARFLNLQERNTDC
jgi:hypothetical protein